MNTFHLEMLSPERAFYSGECVSLTVPVFDGMLGIMAGHLPLTAAVFDGEASFTKPDGEKVVCAVSRGMLNVSGKEVRLLCGEIFLPNEIDETKEQYYLHKAENEMKQRQSAKRYALLELSLAEAMNNLNVKKRYTLKK